MLEKLLTAIIFIISFAIALGLLYAFLSLFFRRVYLPYKNHIYNSTFDELILILKTVINTELDAYQTDIFLAKGSITNSNFDNYFKDITTKIVDNLPDELVDQLSIYISKPMVYRLIARSVKAYLTEKINGTV